MKTFRIAGAAALFFVLPITGGALALDPEAAARAFLTPGETTGAETTVTFSSVASEGSDIVVKDVRTSVATGAESTEFGNVAEVRLLNVTETGNGQYAASSAVYSNMTISVEGGFSMLMPKIVMDDLRTRDASADKLPMPVTYRSAVGDNISVTIPAQNVKIAISQLKVTMDDFSGDLPKSGTMAVTGIDVPLSAFPPGPTSPAALGYESNLVFDITARGTARYETSGFSIEDLTLSGSNIGSLSFALDMDNYPNLMNAAEANPMEMMSVVLNSVSIKYTDDSFAVRMLDMVAQQQGMKREEYAQQMSMALPFMLSAINNQEFQNKVANAAGTFLQNPGTIELNVKPAKPLSAAEIMGIAQSAPQTLPDELNVTVEAR